MHFSCRLFGFGDSFIGIMEMLYKGIINYNTSQRFEIKHSVRQGCHIPPFLFLLVTVLLSLSVVQDLELRGICIFEREIKITHLAVDTTLFLKDKSQFPHALNLVEQFSNASSMRYFHSMNYIIFTLQAFCRCSYSERRTTRP